MGQIKAVTSQSKSRKEFRMLTHVNCAEDIALLAPVPKEHLVSALTTMEKVNKVAFASRGSDVFITLDEKCKGKTVDVFIYESYGGGHYDPKVSWRARYLRFEGAVNGMHPNPEFRPPSTASDTNDSLLFWEVDSLEQIEEQNRAWVGTFIPYGKNKPYGNSFAPHGPLLIRHP
jgi:hypothetical protein